MPTNHTTNYQLNQWEPGDQVRRVDFNADNEKIDGALGSQAAMLASHAAALSKLGNCQIEHFTYGGSGEFGPEHPTVIQFPKKPTMFVIFAQNMSAAFGSRYADFCVACLPTQIIALTGTWSGNQLSLINYSTAYTTSARDQLNASALYHVFAFYAQDT